MEQALRGVRGSNWYTPPSDVVQQGGNNWFLVGPDGRPINDITHLPGDVVPSSPTSGAPGDSGTGPTVIGQGNGNGNGRRFPFPSPFPGGGVVPPIGG
jgi:hypothetical protein